MDFLLSRYRNLTVLLVVLLGQLILLAWQVKSNNDVRLIRVWAVTAVTPLARVLESIRGATLGTVQEYFILVGVRGENTRVNAELGRLKMENQYLRNELATADRARSLVAFQKRTPSKTVAARIIGTGSGTSTKVVFVDRGTTSGVLKGMAVVTPDGIVGKVIGSYPTAAQVQLITDPSFASGVISTKNRVHGTLRGLGRTTVKVDYVQNEEKVDAGEWFYTSGDDRVFPKGMPVGQVSVARPGPTFKDIFVSPSGFQKGLEEVLIVVGGVHQQIPEQTADAGRIHLLPPPPPEVSGDAGAPPASSAPAALTTDADRLRDRYKKLGEAQGHQFGVRGRPPNFNLEIPKPAPAKQVVPPPAGSPAPSASPPPR